MQNNRKGHKELKEMNLLKNGELLQILGRSLLSPGERARFLDLGNFLFVLFAIFVVSFPFLGAWFLCSMRSFGANILRFLFCRIANPCLASFAAQVLVYGFLLWAEPAQGQTKENISHAVKLLERKAETGVPDQPELLLMMRLPPGHTPENPTAKGVLAFCTWQGEADSLRKRLADESDDLVRYAKRNHLALLTWNTATLWKTGKSYHQVNRREFQGQRDEFDKVARAWETGVGKLCREQNLPSDGFLLYGISRGAHWSGRLALRLPERFLAVHIHVANSYDRPWRSAGQPLWLVSSGDLDIGRNNALTFYRECREKGYPMVLKVINGLGHSDHAENVKLRTAFFDYALRLKKESLATGTPPSALMVAGLDAGNFTGDVLSQEVYRGPEGRKVPEMQRVALPDEGFARAWGFLRK